MTRQNVVVLAAIIATGMMVLGLAVSASTREPYAGDPYEDAIAALGNDLSKSGLPAEAAFEPEPPEHTAEEIDGQEEAEPTATEERSEPEKPPLPEAIGDVYVDASTPSMQAGNGVVMGEPVVRGTMALVPLYPANLMRANEERFLTLAEAVESGKVTVVDSESADTVYIVNKSNCPVYLMCGEIIFGGKQDRVIAQDTVVPAERDKRFKIDVFCVERNRWSPGETGYAFTCKPDTYVKKEYGENESPDHGAQLPSLAQTIENKKREAFQNLAGRGIAYACMKSGCGEGGQSEVWQKVGETNNRLGTDNPTNTYRNNLLSPEVHSRICADLDTFYHAVKCDSRAVGYAFALDGTVLYCDIFANADLCKSYRYRLIKAYLIETLGQGVNPRFVPDSASFKDFLKWVENNRQEGKGKPGFAYFKSDYLVGCDSTYKGRCLHSGYYYDGFSAIEDE